MGKNEIYRYLLFSVVAFFPGLFLGTVYFDNDLFQSIHFFQDYFREGVLGPRSHWWNPYLLGGQPFFEDVHSFFFYPFEYLTLLVPAHQVHAFFCAVHLLIGLIGVHWWLRSLGLSEMACGLGAVLFGSSGCFWTEIVHPIVVADVVWVPWIFWSLETFFEKPGPVLAFRSGAVVSLFLLVGQYQVIHIVACLALVYALARVVERGGGIGWKNWGTYSFSFFLGIFPSVLLFAPVLEFAQHSSRFQAAIDYKSFNADDSLGVGQLWQILFPARPCPAGGGIQPFSNFLGNLGYTGVWTPFWAFAGLFLAKRRWAPWVGGGMVLSLLIALGNHTFVHPFLCAWVPGFSFFRAASRYLFLFSIAVIVLGALGAEVHLRGLDKGSRTAKFLPVLYAATMGAMILRFSDDPWPQVACLSLGSLFFLTWSLSRRPWFRPAFFLAVALSALNVGWTLSASRSGPPSNFDIPGKRPELSAIAPVFGHSRIFLRPDIPYPVQTRSGPATINFPVNSGWALGLKNMRGYNSTSLYEVERLAQLGPEKLSSLMALRGFLSGTDLGDQPGFRKRKQGDLWLYLCEKDHPFVLAPARVVGFEKDGQAFSAMASPGFDPGKEAVFSGTQAERPGSGPVDLRWDWIEDFPDEESFDVSVARSSWVVFSDVAYPGWKAWIDGRESAIRTADTCLRALFVTQGKHRIRFSFQPFWMTWVKIGLSLWLFSLVLFWVFGARAARTSPRSGQ